MLETHSGGEVGATGLEGLTLRLAELSEQLVLLQARVAELESGTDVPPGCDIDTINKAISGTRVPFYKPYGSPGFTEQILVCPHLGRMKHSADAWMGGDQFWRTINGKYQILVGGYSGKIENVALVSND